MPQMPKLPALPTRRPRPTAGRSGSRPAQMSPSRKVRGLTLLTALAALIVTAGLAAFSVVVWWAPLIAVAAVGTAFFWLRSGVQGETAARKAMRRRVVRDSRQTPAQAPVAQATAQEATPTAEVADWTADPELVERTTVVAQDDEGDEKPEGWSPVPVPPPTYTLKAKAERPVAMDAPGAAVETPAETTTASGEFADEQRAAYGT